MYHPTLVVSSRSAFALVFLTLAAATALADGGQEAKLQPNDSPDTFGLAVAMDGATAIVGAPFDDDFGSNSGSAYLFDTITGQPSAKLHPGDPQINRLSSGLSG